MLLVTFHGGSGGVPNVYAYNTSTNELNTDAALADANLGKDTELRGLVYANPYLYVVNGDEKDGGILCFQPPAPGSTTYQFNLIGTFLGVSTEKGQFTSSMGHPYSLVFNGQSSCYVSNQDTNVVAQAKVASDSKTASIKKGCRSAYLEKLTSICPKGGCVYLDGTFVASQTGALPDVAAAPTDVPSQYGGLSVSFSDDKGQQKVQNSVRDLAIADAVLMVCDEPSTLIRLYSLPDGDYLGSGPTLPSGPTHLAAVPGGLFVSAGNQLYWSAPGASPAPSGLCFTSILTAPAGYSVGGIAFNTAGSTVYVVFQMGKGTTGSGTIYSYTVDWNGQQPPALSGTLFASITTDTPEFVLFVPDPEELAS